MVTTKLWEFEALDTLFFRDGTPHEAGEGGGLVIKSLFPPFVFTMQGAIRTGLALGQGWQPGGSIPFPEALGDSDNLGEVSFEGPYLKDNGQYLFDVPLHILHRELKEFSRVIPQEKRYVTDLGEVNLPVLAKPLPGAKTMHDYLMAVSGLQSILSGKMPEVKEMGLVKKSDLWQQEERVGLALDKTKGTAEEGKLYFTSHIRPKKGLSVVVKVKGLDEKWHGRVPEALSLGGEGRMAMVNIRDDEQILPPMPELEAVAGLIRFTVTLITPGGLWPLAENTTENMQELIKKGYPEIPGNLVSGSIGKVKQVGGFDIVRRKPRPLIPMLPPGSTWFYESSSAHLDALKALHGAVTNPLGFNQIVIGKWGS